jgi:hypothetical protein
MIKERMVNERRETREPLAAGYLPRKLSVASAAAIWFRGFRDFR